MTHGAEDDDGDRLGASGTGQTRHQRGKATEDEGANFRGPRQRARSEPRQRAEVRLWTARVWGVTEPGRQVDYVKPFAQKERARWEKGIGKEGVSLREGRGIGKEGLSLSARGEGRQTHNREEPRKRTQNRGTPRKPRPEASACASAATVPRSQEATGEGDGRAREGEPAHTLRRERTLGRSVECVQDGKTQNFRILTKHPHITS